MVAMAVLHRVVGDSPSEKLMFEGGEGTRSHVVIWRKSNSDRGNTCSGPGAEPVCLPCLREVRSPSLVEGRERAAGEKV